MNESNYILVQKNIHNNPMNVNFTAGTLEIKGDFEQKMKEDGHLVILNQRTYIKQFFLVLKYKILSSQSQVTRGLI